MPTGIREVLLEMLTFDDIDVAEGVNLDVTGALVGQSRIYGDGLVANDDQYRLLIRLRVLRNNGRVATAEYLAALVDFFDAVVRISLDSAMTLSYVVMREPTDDEVAILDEDIVARPMGVKVIRSFAPGVYFGYSSDPGASGYNVGPYVEGF